MADSSEATHDSIRRTAAAWIAAADIKATALLAVAGGMLALLTVLLTATGGAGVLLSRETKWSFVLFAALATLSVAASGVVLLPRLDRAKILRAGGISKPTPRSPSFFADLGDLSYEEFLKETAVDAAKLATDAKEQAFVLVVIARRKMIWMRVSILALMGALGALALVVAFTACAQ